MKLSAMERDDRYQSAKWRLTCAKDYAAELGDVDLTAKIDDAIEHCTRAMEALAPEIRREAEAEREDHARIYRRITQ